MKAKLIQCNVPAHDLPKVREFYAKLLGTDDFARSLTEQVVSYHLPISFDGIKLTLTARQHGQEPIVCYFAVEDIHKTLQELRSAGGTVVAGPWALPVDPGVLEEYRTSVKQFQPDQNPGANVGYSALVRDPDGNIVGLTQLQPDVQKQFKFGRFAVALDDEQVAQHERARALGEKVGGYRRK
jgi:predicted enzyme related to lactoylglutathione lyase